ncbi:sulfotransferase domain-containing protein [Glycomyces luteolus]|uniref:Sulfotransferase domain-containing protein n=1 Tax=Glycomyces luteolus TaxID=2670330 RepID=A0A9X3PCA4_9ACTN|nr:sulfotransferase domain-containing protein [Glycomyces luteolus]MDA1362751.1 sulfotransferase domain-containing protein [Glycomyces luteolus]
MIVWLASFPRSGNTFFRIALNRLYGAPTYVVYDVDGVAAQIGADLMDARDRPGTFDQMRDADEVYFVKTHRRRDDPVIAAEDRAVCLVRDGRECVVSWARLWTRQHADEPDYEERFAEEARSIITRTTGGTGGWGQNVLSWHHSASPAPIWVRFEDLIANPRAAVETAIGEAAPGLTPARQAELPTFGELHAREPGFFRSGTTGAHQAELPPDLHDLFWDQPDNATAMRLNGYR